MSKRHHCDSKKVKLYIAVPFLRKTVLERHPNKMKAIVLLYYINLNYKL